MVSSAHLRVRPAKKNDRQFVFEVRRAAFHAYVEQIAGWNDTEQRLTADREFDELPFEIVEEGWRPVGYLCVIHENECDFIEEIALLPEAQGRGIGTQLLRDILQAAQKRGVPVRLSVFTNNPAQGLYARLGFEVKGIEHPRVRMEWSPNKT
ncbi:GNAT family N-acetyltransferase [Actinopolymorpha alba]|uniref:GNAT family N-acetyltransferase n=1 Tax=Actinopolymorpha alba TaxID=533267 RepID=UPI0003783369|nr:GNAT family N-acetyltransferase [Actinopolymorpha alba]